MDDLVAHTLLITAVVDAEGGSAVCCVGTCVELNVTRPLCGCRKVDEGVAVDFERACIVPRERDSIGCCP